MDTECPGDALPNVPSDTSKESYRDHVQKSFYAGMYTHGGVSALRSSCAEHAESIKVFADLIRAVHPRQMFTSLVVLDGAQNNIHRDSRNACVPNLVIPLTRFSGGELFLEKPDGEPHTVGDRTVCGELVSLSEGPVTFGARHVSHGGLPSPDRRVVLIACCLRGAPRLKAEQTALRGAMQWLSWPFCRIPRIGFSGTGHRSWREPPSAFGSHLVFRSSPRPCVVVR